jgi:hypothetical protein
MEKTWKSTVAGVLCIVAGGIGILRSIPMIGGAEFGGQRMHMWGWLFDIQSIFGDISGVTLGIILAICGIVALIGGIYALNRKMWGLALAGAILAIFVSNFLGILSVIFVALARGEFDQAAKAN